MTIGRVRVLMIDDDLKKVPSSATDYLEALQVNGFEVESYSSAKLARDHIKSCATPEDVVILDMMLPKDFEDDDGVAHPLTFGAYILKKLLRHPESVYQGVPVLVLTNQDLATFQHLVAGYARVWVERKPNVPPFFLPQLLRTTLKEASDLS